MARIKDVAEAERLARHIDRVYGGSFSSYRRAKPARQWTKGANGLWRSTKRGRS